METEGLKSFAQFGSVYGIICLWGNMEEARLDAGRAQRREWSFYVRVKSTCALDQVQDR